MENISWRAGAALAALVLTSFSAVGCGSTEPTPSRPAANEPASPSGQPVAPRVPGDLAATASADDRLKDEIAVFRRSRRGSDRLPKSMAGNIRGAASSGENPALGRRILGGERERLYLVPAAGGACLFEGTGSGACTTTELLLQGKLLTVSSCTTTPAGKPAFDIVGVAPDRIDKVVVMSTGQPVRSLDVTDNAYATQFEVPADIAPPLEVAVPADRSILRDTCGAG